MSIRGWAWARINESTSHQDGKLFVPADSDEPGVMAFDDTCRNRKEPVVVWIKRIHMTDGTIRYGYAWSSRNVYEGCGLGPAGDTLEEAMACFDRLRIQFNSKTVQQTTLF